MSLRAQALSMLDTVLRVPPLFIMDEVLKSCFGLSRVMRTSDYSDFLRDENPFMNAEGFGQLGGEEKIFPVENETIWNMDEYSFITSITPAVARIVMFVFVYMTATVAFLLSSQRLIKVYFVIVSFAVIVIGYQANVATIRYLTSGPESGFPSLMLNILSLNTTALFDSGGTIITLGANYIFQGSLGYLFTLVYSGPNYPLLQKLLIVSFILPSALSFFCVPNWILVSIPLLSALLPLAVLKYTVFSNLLKCIHVVLEGYHYARRVMRDFGLHSLLESEWVRLNIPNVLRTFWMLRMAMHLATLLGEFMYVRGEYQSLFSLTMADFYVIFKAIMTQGCETAVALLGMTSIVSYICHYVGVVFQMILLTVEDDERSMGTVCAILFFILAEQSGLTVMGGEKRFVRLCRNFCLLFTAMLHFIHNMVNPVLMSLSASRNPALYRHIRALVVCSILVFLPVMLLFVLWSLYPLSTWLLAVSAFSVQVVVKTLVSLLIYGLFLVDAYCSTFWERLDDYVYYIRAFGNSVEFIFGILLFFNGAWIYIFESGGSIRAFMMCIHAYFNIWCEARNGWTVFMKRRTAVNKINSLPEATQEQLVKHDDVCAICFQGLHSAKITKCNHYFHSVCLRKWLYIQDSCPLCHETLYNTDTSRTDNANASRRENEGGEQNHANAGDEANADVPVWDGQDIDVILGENMNGSNRELVRDNEVGEALIVQAPDRPHEDIPPAAEPSVGDDGEIDQHLPQRVVEENPQLENNQRFILRSRRPPIIDQDIGQ
ncbi:protein TRC8 homolog isoform X1 [Macrobrachium nipponense]|uniref:protein TRC8 homolog isoform X1 n=2 Tax=Macrobrachium nipponense TaxID=159736 RepID=UPI0030C85DCD